MIATGVWKPKNHKAMAEKARQAWKRLKRQKGERLWIQHAHLHNVRDGGWLGEALHRAAEGKHGARVCTQRTSVSTHLGTHGCRVGRAP